MKANTTSSKHINSALDQRDLYEAAQLYDHCVSVLAKGGMYSDNAVTAVIDRLNRIEKLGERGAGRLAELLIFINKND